MKLYHAFAALLPVVSTQASALENTQLRELNESQPKENGNIFDQAQETNDPQGNGGQDSPPGLDGSAGPPEFTVKHVSSKGVPSKEELHGNEPAQGGGRPANIPAQVDMTARIEGMSVGDLGGVQSRNGEIDVSDLGHDFSKVPVLVFKGLGDGDDNNKPLVLKRVDVNVPLPKIWKPQENGDLIGEDAQVWYGEEVGGEGTANGMFMANANGGLVGSIQDGIDTYAIETEYKEDSTGHGNWRASTKYSVVKLADLPPEADADESGPERRLLRSNLRKAGVDATKVIEKSRELQADCDDIEGYFGSWYDSDGPYYDCDWYAQTTNACSNYGDGYSNFGFTANQACCACAGGGVLIDVLVVYSSGSQRDRLDLVNLCIYQTNLALSNSGSNARLRLVGFRYHSYSEGKGASETLGHLKNANDGQLESVRGWREDYGADVVHYIGNINDYAGIAQTPGVYAVSDPDYAARSGKYTFAHEWAHNMGCNHDIDNSNDKSGFDHGYLGDEYCGTSILGICFSWKRTRTIMSYGGERILQFSNTVNSHDGRSVGDATTANNARTITERAQATRDNRTAKVIRTVELCKHYGCEGGSFRASHTIGDFGTMPHDIENDELSQVYIPQGLSFEYFENTSFGGWHRAFGSTTNDVLLNMGGHNDAVSSFKVRQIPSGQVKLCRHGDCSGGYVFYSSVGTYTSMPSIIGNDALSYVYIPRGFKFKYFEHTNLGGWNRSFGSKDYNTLLSMGGHNDAVSSFIISVL